MKKFFCLIFLFQALSASAQEELFGDNNGVSLSYLRMYHEYDESNFAMGLSVLVNKSIAINAGFLNNERYSSPMAGIAYYSPTGISFLRYIIGLSYARARVTHYSYNSPQYYSILGLNFGLFRCFFPTKAFPFSVTTNISVQATIGSNSENKLKPKPVAGIHFTQGLFAKGPLYPFISLGLTHGFESKINLYSAALGLNVKIKSKKKRSTEDYP